MEPLLEIPGPGQYSLNDKSKSYAFGFGKSQRKGLTNNNKQ
jgi:hypothetical protein